MTDTETYSIYSKMDETISIGATLNTQTVFIEMKDLNVISQFLVYIMYKMRYTGHWRFVL